ncbi:MAG: hypothetical protein PVJ92_01970 [Candidatus Dependentiae bacterium]|jgi:hypothetical protein
MIKKSTLLAIVACLANAPLLSMDGPSPKRKNADAVAASAASAENKRPFVSRTEPPQLLSSPEGEKSQTVAPPPFLQRLAKAAAAEVSDLMPTNNTAAASAAGHATLTPAPTHPGLTSWGTAAAPPTLSFGSKPQLPFTNKSIPPTPKGKRRSKKPTTPAAAAAAAPAFSTGKGIALPFASNPIPATPKGKSVHKKMAAPHAASAAATPAPATPPSGKVDLPFASNPIPTAPPSRGGGAAATPPHARGTGVGVVVKKVCPPKPEKLPLWANKMVQLYREKFPEETAGTNNKGAFSALCKNQEWVKALPDSVEEKDLSLTKVIFEASTPKEPTLPPADHQPVPKPGCPAPGEIHIPSVGDVAEYGKVFVMEYRMHLVENAKLYGLTPQQAETMPVFLPEQNCMVNDLLGQAEKVLSGQLTGGRKESLVGLVRMFNFLTAICTLTDDEQMRGYWQFTLDQLWTYASFFREATYKGHKHFEWSNNMITYLQRYKAPGFPLPSK